MNYDGPWSWSSTKQAARTISDDERAHRARVSRNKQNASSRRARKRRQAQARAIRARNDAPIF